MLTELACYNQDSTYNDILKTVFVATEKDFYVVNENERFNDIETMKELGNEHPNSGHEAGGSGDHFHMMIGRVKSDGIGIVGLTDSSFKWKTPTEELPRNQWGMGARKNEAGNLCPAEGKIPQQLALENGDLNWAGSRMTSVNVSSHKELTYNQIKEASQNYSENKRKSFGDELSDIGDLISSGKINPAYYFLDNALEDTYGPENDPLAGNINYDGSTNVPNNDNVSENSGGSSGGSSNNNIYGCFKSGTPIEMFDGTVKNIENIKEGDIVKSYKEGKYTSGIVTKHLIHPINDVIPVVSINNIIGSIDHPIFINNEWYELAESPLDKINLNMFIDNWYNLEIDGHTIHNSEHNYIINGYIMSGLGDNKVLNDIFSRQKIFKSIKLV